MAEANSSKKTVTLEDVARVAGVSTSSVSRFLSGNVKVSDRRGARIAEAIESLNYQPNTAARTLASGRSATIGILTQEVSSYFYSELTKGVEQELRASHYASLITSTEGSAQAERDCMDVLLARQVDGVIVMGHSLRAEVLGKYAGRFPLVVVGQKIKGARCICLVNDYTSMAKQAVKHLIDLGHTRIGFVGGLRTHPDVIARLRGYKLALEEAGLPFDPELVEPGDMFALGGGLAVAKLIEKGVPFTALFAANDENAMGARLELYRRDLSVPGDVSLVGFDDVPAASLMIPPLTTVKQSALESGCLAARAIMALLLGREFKEQLPQLELVCRETTAPPARRPGLGAGRA